MSNPDELFSDGRCSQMLDFIHKALLGDENPRAGCRDAKNECPSVTVARVLPVTKAIAL